MPFKDEREFLAKLKELGELKEVDVEVDWNEEIGAIAQESLVRGRPALLFKNIKGYKDTHCKRIAMNTHESLKRVKIALGIDLNTSPKEMIQFFREKIKTPIKPMLISHGSCKEFIEKGDKVDLFEFPVPKIHGKDGGRYIMSWHTVITKDPETGWVNLGTYRGMVHDRNSIGVIHYPTQHWAFHGRKYKAMGRSMPMAVAIGLEPVTMMVSSTPFPAGVNEYDMIGAIRGEPLELVKCETVDLEVPAEAEIILEGELLLEPEYFKPEGPFGEYTGHYVSLQSQPRPVFKVNCVTHREDPIFRSRMVGVVSPKIATEQGSFLSITFSAVIWDQLEIMGVPGIKGVSVAGPGGAIAIISIEQLYYGHARQVAAALWGTTLSSMVGKFVIVVDSDVDIYDINKVLVAVANRCRGAKDVIAYEGTFGGPLDPSNSPEVLKETGEIGRWDRVLIDATWPYEWAPREEWGGLKHPPACLAEEDIMEKVRGRWDKYGIG
ncbi:MAG: UbiD family decarboxylase [Syntrophales bacterium]|nr:UbiD family decarboxylase [Syntrophales bacterium]